MAVASSYCEASCYQATSETRAHCYQHILRNDGYPVGTADVKSEEGAGYGRSVCPESPGLHAGYNGRDNGSLPREGLVISQTRP